MAEPTTPDKTQHKASNDNAESPTTAQPLDFDDDMQETGVIGPDGTTTTTSTPAKPPRTSSMQPHVESTADEEAPPKKPPRPMSVKEQNQVTLIEAFPTVDTKVVKAVLDASGNNVEQAFNALLRMSDPESQDVDPEPEEQPPPRPPRPTAQQRQMEEDELYARQLAAHYNSTGGFIGQAPNAPRDLPPQRRQNDDDEPGTSLEDDFSNIRENVRQGFLSTQTKVNQWITDFKKRIDGEDEDEIGPGPGQAQRQNFGPSQTRQMQGIRQMGAQPRRSTDRDRYDADPKVLGDDFSQLEMHDEEATDEKTSKKQRPHANPDLFKPTPAAPQSGPVDEIDALYRQPTPQRQPSPSAGGKGKKWQPLTSVAPNPEGDDNDPFALGDSDEEKEEKKHDLREEDTRRLKKAAESHTDLAETKRRDSLASVERTGSHATRDKVAEDLLKGKK